MNHDRAAAIAGWWASALEVEEKREAFRAALLLLVQAEQFDDSETFCDFWKIDVDYDPGPTLLAAIRAAGIECRGFMYSADGLLPTKTRMRIARDSDAVTVSQIVRDDGRRAMRDEVIFGAHHLASGGGAG